MLIDLIDQSYANSQIKFSSKLMLAEGLCAHCGTSAKPKIALRRTALSLNKDKPLIAERFYHVKNPTFWTVWEMHGPRDQEPPCAV